MEELHSGERVVDAAVHNTLFLEELAQALTEPKTVREAVKLVKASGADVFAREVAFADSSRSKLENAKLYFFCAFEQDERIAEVCTWKDLMEALGLPEYYVEVDVKRMSLYFPAFIVSERHPLHSVYVETRDALEAAESAADLTARLKAIIDANTRPAPIKACIVNTVKMMLVLAVYYDSYTKDIPRPTLATAAEDAEFRKLLDILPREAGAFSAFAGGQKRLAQPEFDQVLDPLTALFSYEGRQNTAESSFDPTISHLMVNLLAYSFGCGRGGSYLYERIFCLPELSHTYGPGSSFNRENRDCGFIMTEFDSEGRGSLHTDNPPIMNNIMGYRYALNSTFWCLLSMAMVVNDSWREAKGVYSLISYIDEVDIAYKGRRRTEREMVRSYLFERAGGFFNQFKYDPMSKELHIDQIHFINEVLYEHYILSNNIDPAHPKPAAVKAHFSSKEEAVKYEKVLLDLFNKVKANYNERKKMLREQVLLLYKQLAHVMDVRAQNSKFLKTPLFEMRDFSNMISDKKPEPESTEATTEAAATTVTAAPVESTTTTTTSDAGGEESAAVASTASDPNEDCARDHIQNFYSYEKDFPKMRYLPAITQFYTELIDTLDYKVTPEAAREVIMPELVKSFSTEGENGKALAAMWDRFLDAWNMTKAMLRPECDLAAEYEAQAAEMETALLSETVSLSDDTESTGGQIIMLLKDGFARIQDPLLESLQTKLDDNDIWNRDELSFNPNFSNVIFDTLSPDSDNQRKKKKNTHIITHTHTHTHTHTLLLAYPLCINF